MSIFVNRSLNLKKIKAIGFDMDYTIVRYNGPAFEQFTFHKVIQKLIEFKKYPKSIEELSFDYHRVIQGLVIDKEKGNLLKLSRFGRVKLAYHGTHLIPFREQQTLYKNIVDLNESHIQSLDTTFSISNGVLYSLLVDLKEQGIALPHYSQLANDIKEMIDLAHADGTLKNEVRSNIAKYIIKDKEIVQTLERLKKYGKKILIITNSDFSYTKLLLDFAIDPFLQEHPSWQELFDYVITASQKPRFFTDRPHFLKVDPSNGLMSNLIGGLTPGIYQGGNAAKLQKDLQLEGEEILYLGDHIYGDVVSLKKTFNWRTGLVLEPLIEEIHGIKKAQKVQESIDQKMQEKEMLELKLQKLYAQEFEHKTVVDKNVVAQLLKDIDEINSAISSELKKYQQFFNPFWGQLMRAGQEEARFAGQVEKYACIYMAKVSDLLNYSPRIYFRPHKRILPHEQV